MKNKILQLLFLLNIFEDKLYSALPKSSMVIGYLHNQIHEETVPEFKIFNEKIKKLFQNQSSQIRETMIKDIQNFGNQLIIKLENKLEFNKDLTLAERKTIEEVIYKIKEKLKKLVKNVIF